MLKIVGISILVASAVDLIFALVWLGLIGYGEIRNMYRSIKEDKYGKTN